MDPEITGTQAQQPVQTPVAPTIQQAPVAAPVAPQVDPVRDRTREQFDKLLESNQRLFDQNELLRQEMQQRLGAQPAPAQVPPAQSAPATGSEYDFYEVDAKTGEQYINRDKLNSYMRELNEKATRAEVTAQKLVQTTEHKEIERQNQEAWAAYPELNPTNKAGYNDTFGKMVEGVLMHSMMNAGQYGGRPLTFKEAADFVRGTTGQPTTQGTPAPATADDSGNALKEAGSAQVPSQHQSSMNVEDTEELRNLQILTRRGNAEALARRLMHTEHILTPDARQV